MVEEPQGPEVIACSRAPGSKPVLGEERGPLAIELPWPTRLATMARSTTPSMPPESGSGWGNGGLFYTKTVYMTCTGPILSTGGVRNAEDPHYAAAGPQRFDGIDQGRYDRRIQHLC